MPLHMIERGFGVSQGDPDNVLTLEDLGGGRPDKFDAHVWRWSGFDLTAAGEWPPSLPACPWCVSKCRTDEQIVFMDHEAFPDGRYLHFVQCGRCGFRRPGFRLESLAQADWIALSRRAGSA